MELASQRLMSYVEGFENFGRAFAPLSLEELGMLDIIDSDIGESNSTNKRLTVTFLFHGDAILSVSSQSSESSGEHTLFPCLVKKSSVNGICQSVLEICTSEESILGNRSETQMPLNQKSFHIFLFT